MNILLLDCSSKTAGYGFASGGEFVFQKKLEGNRNADALLFELKNDFKERGLDFTQTDVVSLSNGPGSFTGLRIGSAIAKAVCFTLGAKLVQIPTLDIIANLHKSTGEFAAVIFSGMRTGEFYYAVYTNPGILERLSGYHTNSLAGIAKDYKEIVINEKIDFSEKIEDVSIIDVSGYSGIESQLALTGLYIERDDFTDITSAEPFYMQEFHAKQN